MTHIRTCLGPIGALIMVFSVVAALPVAGADVEQVGRLSDARSGHASVRLPDGHILVIGGKRSAGGGDVRTAELIDPATGRSRPAGVLPRRIIDADAVTVRGGRVLIVGGSGGSSCASAQALLWHARTRTFTQVHAIPQSQGASATRLADGRILIAGGGAVCRDGRLVQSGRAKAIIWDPATGSSTPTGSLRWAREYHDAVRLADGRVLVAGGQSCRYDDDYGSCALRSKAEVWDPATGTWTAAGTSGITSGLVRLADGRVAAASSWDRPSGTLRIWDPGSGRFGPAPADPPRVVFGAAAARTADGRLALIGGERAHDRPLRTIQLWDPVSGTTVTDPITGAVPLRGQSVTRLPGNRLVVIGGALRGRRHDVASDRITVIRP